MENNIVLKIGGSLLYDAELKINKSFLVKFISWFDRNLSRFNKILIVIGGGTISRHLVSQVEGFSVSDTSAHRIGMSVTTVNAEILRSVITAEEVFIPRTLGEALEHVIGGKQRVMIAGGFKEGWSTDMDAVVLADVIGSKKVYKLSNIDSVYTADPKTNPDARPLKDLTWQEYFKQFNISLDNLSHPPGGHVPVSASAAQFASQKGISFFVSGGSLLDSDEKLENVFESGSFIHP